MSDYTFVQALELWNAGFQGYAMDMTRTLDLYIQRFGQDAVSPEMSVVADVDGQPAGFVVNGLTEVRGKKIAWNGGTGVAPAFRGQGIASKLMEASIEIYRQQGAEFATLEALSTNEPAIAVYQKMGYAITENLAIVRKDDAWLGKVGDSVCRYVVKPIHPALASTLAFYAVDAPWQNQWNHIQGVEALAAYDADGVVTGYTLYRKSFDSEGLIRAIVLYQCRTSPTVLDIAAVITALLEATFNPKDVNFSAGHADSSSKDAACVRMGFNLPKSDGILVDALQSAGFQSVVEQVQMRRAL